ncbi:MAG: DEAD/DEAH box helicase [Sulfolobales archaeon]
MHQYLHPRIVTFLRERLGFEKLTLVQEKVIDYFAKTIDGRVRRQYRHLLVSAPTGSGKTFAVLLPILSEILGNQVSDEPVKILYITPLRALNRDLLDRMKELFNYLGFETAVWHGDTSESEREKIKSKPPLMIITTPESLQYILVSPELRKSLRNIVYVIVDEIHELIDDERGCELSVGLERLWRLTNSHMRIGLSGTIRDLDLVARFLSSNRPYDIVDVSYEKIYDVDVLAPEVASIEDSDPRIDKLSELAEVLKKPILIFSNTRDEVEYLGGILRKRGFNIYVHHGSLSKTERLEAEKTLRGGEVDGVIATSSLELGIDIGYLDNVIQISSPRQVTKLIQRIGRSGHREETISRGYIVTSDNIYDVAESIVIARRVREFRSNKKLLEKQRIRSNPLDVLIHQIIGLALENNNEVSKQEIYDLVRKSYCFNNLDPRDLEEALEYMRNARLIRVRNDKVSATTKGSIYYYTTTMIVDTKKYSVIDIVSRKKLGTLDEEFVLKSLSKDDTIILSGRIWRIERIEEGSIYVSEYSGEEVIVPKWIGQQIPVDKNVAREVCGLLNMVHKDPEKSRKIWRDPALELIHRKLMKSEIDPEMLPGSNKLIVENYDKDLIGSDAYMSILHICLGTRGNRSLAYYIQEALLRDLGVESIISSTPYSLVILLRHYIDPKQLIETLAKKRSLEEIKSILINSLENSDEIRWYIVAVARKMGAINKEVSLDEAKRFSRFYKGTIIWREALEEAFYELLDIDTLYEFLEKLWHGKITVKIFLPNKLSVLSNETLLLLSGFNRRFREVRELLSADTMIDIVKKRLDYKEIELICIVCGYSFTKYIKDLDETVRCERCGSVLVGLNKYRDNRARELIKRILGDPKYISRLKSEDKELIDFVRGSANLIASNGKKAVYVLSATGVGLETAKKILWSSKDYKDLFRNIIYAEIKYTRTRDYWDK